MERAWVGSVALGALLLSCVTPPAPSDPPPPPPPLPQPPPSASISSACVEAHQCLANAEALEVQDASAAERLLGQCAECPGASESIYGLLSTLQDERGDKVKARETLRKGVARFEFSVLLWRALGRLELSMGKTQAGLSALGQAHELKPSDEALKDEYQYALARYGTEADRAVAEVRPMLLDAVGRYELGDAKGALSVLSRALVRARQVPELSAQVHHRIATIQLANGALKEAEEHINKALKQESKPSELRGQILLLQAELLISKKALGEAVKASEEAIRISPREPLAHANLAIAKALMGQEDSAIKALRSAFAQGLARRLSKAEFLGIGPAIERLQKHPEFAQLVSAAWP